MEQFTRNGLTFDVRDGGPADGETVVLPVQATSLTAALQARGYSTIGVDVSELRKAGGGPKCCTLEVRS